MKNLIKLRIKVKKGNTAILGFHNIDLRAKTDVIYLCYYLWGGSGLRAVSKAGSDIFLK